MGGARHDEPQLYDACGHRGHGPHRLDRPWPPGTKPALDCAFTTKGTPLGFLDAQSGARDPDDFGKKVRRHRTPIEEKESFKWLQSFRAVAAIQARCPDTILVSVCDREGDIYELFAEAQAHPEGPKLLVRAAHNRPLQNEQNRLWETRQSRSPEGIQVLPVPRQGSRAARAAHMHVHYAEVKLQAPARNKGQPTPVWAVYAQEQDAPEGVKPLEWMLLTTIAVTSFEQAIEKLVWYTRRWGIEVFHRTLKRGCRIEQRQRGQAGRIEACLAIDMVVAWRIYYLGSSAEFVGVI